MATMPSATNGRRTSLPLVLYVARRDVARRYAGSALGGAWALAFPLLQILVYWGVAYYGLRLGRKSGIPVGVMLIAGMTPWIALNEALVGMTGSFTGNAALLKRLVVPPATMPAASLVAATGVHAVILVVAILLLWAMGYPPAPRTALVLYFAACGSLFAFALGTLLALANAAFRDVGQILGSALMLWFWATPVVWPAELLPPALHWVVTWNPLAYLVGGYRFALLGAAIQEPSLEASLAFWGITACLCALALLVFQQFRRELADFL